MARRAARIPSNADAEASLYVPRAGDVPPDPACKRFEAFADVLPVADPTQTAVEKED